MVLGQIFFGWVTAGTKGRGGAHQLRWRCVIACSTFPVASFCEHDLHPLSAFAGALQETPRWLPPSRARLLCLRGQGEEQGRQGSVSPMVGLALFGRSPAQGSNTGSNLVQMLLSCHCSLVSAGPFCTFL